MYISQATSCLVLNCALENLWLVCSFFCHSNIVSLLNTIVEIMKKGVRMTQEGTAR